MKGIFKENVPQRGELEGLTLGGGGVPMPLNTSSYIFTYYNNYCLELII